MAQDTALLRYLLRRGHGGSGGGRDLAFAFDGVNDYISSNATIGRTGYDMNVSGNVTTGSDGDGNYIQFNGNRDGTALTGTLANVGFSSGGFTINQGTDFTIKARVKINSNPTSTTSGIFGAKFAACIYMDTTVGKLNFGLRGSSTTTLGFTSVYTNGQLIDAYLVYIASQAKFYCYTSINGVASTLQNVGGTAGPATFSNSSGRYLSDTGHISGNESSSDKYIYHAAIRNKALTQAEIDADIALGNATKQDSSIVAYYIPENLKYNTQYIANPKALDQSPRAYTGATVTANTDVAPDGTTTADNIVFGAATHRLVQQTITAITGSALASKTFIVKAFVKCTTGTQTFRFRMDHAGVDTNQYSSDFTATTTRQEFTFTRTLTSSTSGTGLFASIANNAGGTAQTIQVRNVRLFLVNETLRDESPNIGGYLGWKTQKVLSCRVKPGADTISTADAGALMIGPWQYMHIRGSTLQVQIRYDDRVTSHASMYNLGTGFRGKAHLLGVYYRNGTVWSTKLYINGIIQDSDSFTVDVPNNAVNTLLWSGRKGNTYYQGNIRDVRIYTFTGSFTDSDAMAIYNGGEPISPGITKYLHYKPPVGEVGTTTEDLTPNNRDGILNGGVTREYI